MRDLAYEPNLLSSCKASEILDLVPYLIAAYTGTCATRKRTICQAPKVSSVSSRWAGSPLPTSDATSTRVNTSCSRIITTDLTNSDTLLSSKACLGTSPYRPLHSMYGYIIRLVLPPIRMIFQIVSLSDTTLLTGYLDDKEEEVPPSPYFSHTC